MAGPFVLLFAFVLWIITLGFCTIVASSRGPLGTGFRRACHDGLRVVQPQEVVDAMSGFCEMDGIVLSRVYFNARFESGEKVKIQIAAFDMPAHKFE